MNKKTAKTEEPLFITDDGQEIAYSDILKTIYQNSVEKQKHLVSTATEVGKMMKKMGDAVALLPYLTALQGVSVKNDEQLVKLAAIVNRGKSGKGSDVIPEDILSQEDRKLIMEQAKQHVPGSAGDY